MPGRGTIRFALTGALAPDSVSATVTLRVRGSTRARMQKRKKGERYYPCDSGTQTRAARP
jgi:hypothetical protein